MQFVGVINPPMRIADSTGVFSCVTGYNFTQSQSEIWKPLIFQTCWSTIFRPPHEERDTSR